MLGWDLLKAWIDKRNDYSKQKLFHCSHGQCARYNVALGELAYFHFISLHFIICINKNKDNKNKKTDKKQPVICKFQHQGGVARGDSIY